MMAQSKTICISINEGRVIRDLFNNGLLDLLTDAGIEVLILCPAASVPDFVEGWTRPGVSISKLIPHSLSSKERNLLRLRNRVLRFGRNAIKLWMSLENRLWKFDHEIERLLKANNCQLAVITNPLTQHEIQVYLAAKSLKLPTLGLIRSWDSLFKGLRIRPETIIVWNSVNRQEAINIMKYSPERVKVLGAPQFDAYFDPRSSWTREKFAALMQLDPARPIITLATLGAFQSMYDETYLVDFLLDSIRTGGIPGRPQLLVRLHPMSKLESFSKYKDLPDVRVSHVTGYIPSLGWTMTRSEVAFIANMLRHSDVIVSPGSTITIEAAIFDTPTIVPIFHTYQPELGKLQFDYHLTNHFKRLKDLDLVPLISNGEELAQAVSRALADPTWYRKQRSQLVKDYIHFTDGNSVERLANYIIETVSMH